MVEILQQFKNNWSLKNYKNRSIEKKKIKKFIQREGNQTNLN